MWLVKAGVFRGRSGLHGWKDGACSLFADHRCGKEWIRTDCAGASVKISVFGFLRATYCGFVMEVWVIQHTGDEAFRYYKCWETHMGQRPCW
jgi:hypothetical protein